MSTSERPRRRWLPWLLAATGLASLVYCFLGYSMVASFSVSNPERMAQWERAAIVYLCLMGVALAVLVAAVAILVRAWWVGRRTVDDPRTVEADLP